MLGLSSRALGRSWEGSWEVSGGLGPSWGAVLMRFFVMCFIKVRCRARPATARISKSSGSRCAGVQDHICGNWILNSRSKRGGSGGSAAPPRETINRGAKTSRCLRSHVRQLDLEQSFYFFRRFLLFKTSRPSRQTRTLKCRAKRGVCGGGAEPPQGATFGIFDLLKIFMRQRPH